MTATKPSGLRARGTARWLLRVFDVSFGHGAELQEAITKEAEGVCFVDSSDSDAALAWALERGWVERTTFQPTFQQRAMGMGGGSAVPAYLTAWGFGPVRAHEATVRAWSARVLAEFVHLHDPGPLAACEVHEWPLDRLLTDLLPTMRARHGHGGLNVCIDCIARAREAIGRRCGIVRVPQGGT